MSARMVSKRYGLGRDKDGDYWLGPLMWMPVEREINHNDRSTTVTINIWWVRRWAATIQFTRGWKD